MSSSALDALASEHPVDTHPLLSVAYPNLIEQLTAATVASIVCPPAARAEVEELARSCAAEKLTNAGLPMEDVAQFSEVVKRAVARHREGLSRIAEKMEMSPSKLCFMWMLVNAEAMAALRSELDAKAALH